MFDKEKIRFYLESYQKDLPKFWSDEKYKWEAVDFFQKNWNIESPDFWGMLKLATSKQVNLLSSGMYFPLGMLQEFIEVNQERVRNMFRMLYAEDKDLIDRIRFYQNEAEELRLTDTNKWKNHYQDLRAVSVLLWLRYPDKYYIYKSKELRKTLDSINSDFCHKGSATAEYYVRFLDMMNNIRDEISIDDELTNTLHELVQSTSGAYEDENLHVATVDFVFYVGKRYENNQSLIDNKLQPKMGGLRKLQIGDVSDNGQITIVDEDRLCYVVKSESRGALAYRTISKVLLNEFVEYFKIHPNASSTDARQDLSGKTNVDKFEYGYNSTLTIMAKMVLGHVGVYEGNNVETYQPNQTDIEYNTALSQTPFSISTIIQHIQDTGLLYTDNLIKRFAFSLMAKRFLILSGLAGSGKTQLALAFANALIADKKQLCVVSVGADWTNREPLLGFPNALKDDEYVRPESGVLDLLIEANKEENKEKPYFLILDEMNMSYVERYFADFLSVMESGEGISLWKGSDESEVPSTISLPKNLFIIGTINVDETTYMFSPKVLDRANVIEFKISSDEMENFLNEMKNVDRCSINGKAAGMGADFVNLANVKELDKDDEAVNTLQNFFKELKKVNAEFGYRTATEIFRYIAQAKKNDDTEEKLTNHDILDAAIIQKLLPKLHGSRKKLEPVLTQLWKLCFTEEVHIARENMDRAIYKESADKILRMYEAANANGFTSFAEA